jgi:hypothetical protein
MMAVIMTMMVVIMTMMHGNDVDGNDGDAWL